MQAARGHARRPAIDVSRSIFAARAFAGILGGSMRVRPHRASVRRIAAAGRASA